MSPAGKLEITMNLYNSGMLCTCNDYEETEHPVDEDYHKEILIHKHDCTASKDKIIELLEIK